MDLQGPDFSDSGDPMVIFSDSRDPNRVPKTPSKTLILKTFQKVYSEYMLKQLLSK